jgi:CTP:molybdopterin cytidylyltransferase MocA
MRGLPVFASRAESEVCGVGYNHLHAHLTQLLWREHPQIVRSSLEKLLKLFEKGEKSIIRFGFEDKVGAPVLFEKRYFEQLRQLPLHNGGSYVMKQHPNEVMICQASSEWELFDVDTQENLQLLSEMIL